MIRLTRLLGLGLFATFAAHLNGAGLPVGNEHTNTLGIKLVRVEGPCG